MKNAASGLIAAICVWLLASAPARAADVPAVGDMAMIQRSLVSEGNLSRLDHVMAKARDGGPVTVAVIGGSITQGAKASTPEKRYGNLVADWWRRTFPNAHIDFVNAGIGATGSNFGALRAQRDLLIHKPDFVIIEFAVNDPNNQAAAETLEGLVRQTLQQPNQPAVMLLFMMNNQGNNAQEWHSKVGQHYALPMISYRDALWPEIQAGRLRWEDISPDEVHPNDRGQAYCASFVTAELDRALRGLPAKDRLPAIPPLPQPLIGDLFDHATVFEADALTPVANDGWTYDPQLKAWKSDKPGSSIEFAVPGRVLFTMHYVLRGPMGKARVFVDGKQVKDLDAWFDGTWGGYRQLNEVARLPDAGPHHVRFQLQEEKNPGSTGTEFRILGLGAAGLDSEVNGK